MAKRAAEPVTGQSAVVDLNNDARWQARLDEARARRAEALRLKGLEDRPKRVPRKPWEDEEETAIAAEKHQRALDDDGLDFHDRMNALQKVMKDKRPEPAKVVAPPVVNEATRNWTSGDEDASQVVAPAPPKPVAPPKVKVEKSGPPVDSVFDDPTFGEPASEAAPVEEPEFVSMDVLVDPLPRKRSAPKSRPWLDEAEEATPAEVTFVPDVSIEKQKPKGGMPFFMGVGLVALLAMPFFHLLPPMLRGPEGPPAPVFGLQPAFGITAAMVEFPVMTQSAEFVPASITAPIAPLIVSNRRAPAFSRDMPSIAVAPTPQPFVMPDVSRHVDASVTSFARVDLPPLRVTQAMWETQSNVGVSAGGLPRVLAPVSADNLVPLPRP